MKPLKSVKTYYSKLSIAFFLIAVMPLSIFLLYQSVEMIIQEEWVTSFLLFLMSFSVSGMLIRQYWVIYKYPIKCRDYDGHVEIRGIRSSHYRKIKLEEIVGLTTFPYALIVHLNTGENITIHGVEVKKNELSSLYIRLYDLLKSNGFIDTDEKIRKKSYKGFFISSFLLTVFMIYSLYSSGELGHKGGIGKMVAFTITMILLFIYTFHTKNKHEQTLRQKTKENLE